LHLIEVKNLSHIFSPNTPYEKKALSGVDFYVEEGERVAIIGRTGSGKTTLISHLNGLLTPTAGEVLFRGENIFASKKKLYETRFHIGLVFQFPEYQLFDETVKKDIAFGPKNMKLTEQEIEERVADSARLAGISEEVLNKSPFSLSGGQKRRAAIAGVLAMRPEVLILDEPTAGLDPKGRSEVLKNIDAFVRETGAAQITVTHSMTEAADRADRIYVMSGGEIAMSGTVSEVFSQKDALQALALDVPPCVEIAELLRAGGLPLPGDIYTKARLISELQKVFPDKSAVTAFREGAPC
jgi:energy-coupling factor transport system ATP-binding protein